MRETQEEKCKKGFLAIRDALDVLKGRWKIQIVGILIQYEKMGFQELARATEGISPKMLSKELKELETNQLVTRRILDTRPATVEYKITEHGRTCAPVISALHEWGVNHRKTIIESFDKSVAKKL